MKNRLLGGLRYCVFLVVLLWGCLLDGSAFKNTGGDGGAGGMATTITTINTINRITTITTGGSGGVDTGGSNTSGTNTGGTNTGGTNTGGTNTGGSGGAICDGPTDIGNCVSGTWSVGETGVDCGGECREELGYLCPAGEGCLMGPVGQEDQDCSEELICVPDPNPLCNYGTCVSP